MKQQKGITCFKSMNVYVMLLEYDTTSARQLVRASSAVRYSTHFEIRGFRLNYGSPRSCGRPEPSSAIKYWFSGFSEIFQSNFTLAQDRFSLAKVLFSA